MQAKVFTSDFPKLSTAFCPAERVMAGINPLEAFTCSKANVDSKESCSSVPFRVNAGVEVIDTLKWNGSDRVKSPITGRSNYWIRRPKTICFGWTCPAIDLYPL